MNRRKKHFKYFLIVLGLLLKTSICFKGSFLELTFNLFLADLKNFKVPLLESYEKEYEFGFSTAFDAQWKLGNSVREALKNWGIKSVAADGFGDHIFTQPHGVHP